jgi:hypothetical protein
MSSRHAPAVRALIRSRWGERYQSMPLRRALLALHRTGRVYKNATTLADVPGGKEWPTLLPRDAAPSPGSTWGGGGTSEGLREIAQHGSVVTE